MLQKRMFQALCCLLIFGCLTLSVNSTQAAGRHYGGFISCGEITENKNNARDGEWMFWSLGYISGLNASHDISYSKRFEIVAIWVAVKKYCAENPLDDQIDATQNVWRQMRKHQK